MFGWFEGKKTTYVSSVAYNLAGDVKDRSNFLKTLTLSHTLANTKETRTRKFLDSYLGGPGINLRRFGQWAEASGYAAAIGTSNSRITVLSEIDTTALANVLSTQFGKPVYVNDVDTGIANYFKWALQYVLRNHPTRYNENWVSDFDEATQEVVLTFPNTAPIRFSPVGYDHAGQYLYALMTEEIDASSSSSIGSWLLGTGPSKVGYTKVSLTTASETVNTVSSATITRTVAGSDPVVSTLDTPVSRTISLTSSVYVKNSTLPDAASSLVIGMVTDGISNRQRYEIKEVTTSDTIVQGDVITAVVRVDRVPQIITEYQLSKVITRPKAWDSEQLFIYRRGTGNAALDALFVDATTTGTFFPVVPVRVQNRFVQAGDGLYPWVEKATRRATNTSFDKLVSMIGSNASLKDIDFAYLVFGVSLNTPENAAKRYIYEFFSKAGLGAGEAALSDFWTNYYAALAGWDAWVTWYTQYRHVAPQYRSPGISYEEPYRPSMPILPTQTVVISSAQNYSVSISFSGVSETIHSGKYLPTAKINDLRIYSGPSTSLMNYSGGGDGLFFLFEAATFETVIIEWQIDENTFKRLRVSNPVHRNYVYDGKTITITAGQALSSGSESGFIIPLQDDAIRSMPIPVSTQLATACSYIVFNCYQTVKQEWYETDFFRIILVVAVIVISVYSGGTGAATSGGLLGSNAAIGATLGFAGTTAIVVGAIANAIVGMIVNQIITRLSTQIFGEKFGEIIGAITSIVVLSIGSEMSSGKSLSASFGKMMSAENLTKLTVATVNGITDYVKATTAGIAEETAQVTADYEKESKAIAEKYAEEFGLGNGVDVGAVSNVLRSQLEKPETFLSRTLLNGTEIADMSLSMLDNFTELSLNTSLE